jgi:hypothetical protein
MPYTHLRCAVTWSACVGIWPDALRVLQITAYCMSITNMYAFYTTCVYRYINYYTQDDKKEGSGVGTSVTKLESNDVVHKIGDKTVDDSNTKSHDDSSTLKHNTERKTEPDLEETSMTKVSKH